MTWLLGLLLLVWSTGGTVTHYGVGFHGGQMGCEGSGWYDTDNPWIVAVAPESGLRCGDLVYVEGPAGDNLGIVLDTCVGCGSTNLDLSEAGIARVCGPEAGTCNVWWGRVLLPLGPVNW